MPRRNLIWIAIVVVVSLVSWRPAPGAPNDNDYYEFFKTFADAMEQVERNYVTPVDRRKLFEGALRGMLNDLDPYSSYISPEELRRFDINVRQQFGGIGIQITLDEGTRILTVMSPLVGTPAYKAGVLAGDKILEIDGESSEGIALNEAVDKLTGDPGTKVTITVLHEGATEPEKIEIERAIIHIETVLGDVRKPDDSWDFMIDKANKIGYVRVTSFSKETASELLKALESLKAEGMRGLVMDLRVNPGGLLTSAIEVSDLFVSEGTIVSTRGRNQDERVQHAHKAGTFEDFPMAVLVNRYSASASEIVAACLQDHTRAVIVGSRTWGKGSVQNVIELEGGQSALKLTTATYWRPSGKNIHKMPKATDKDEWGVQPNEGYDVDFTPEEMRKYVDNRRDRDIVHKAGAHPEAAPKDEPKKDDSNKEATDGEKPAETEFVDRQLQKAMEYVTHEIVASAQK